MKDELTTPQVSCTTPHDGPCAPAAWNDGPAVCAVPLRARAEAGGLTRKFRTALLWLFGSGMLPVGKLFGIPIQLHFTLFFLAGEIVARFGVSALPLFGATLISLLLHELGHALVALRLGYGVTRIFFWLLGGTAVMEKIPRNPTDELLVAVAGPAVSVALASLGLCLGIVLDLKALTTIGLVNYGIAVFNLLPILPMDGGRILRAVLHRKMDYVRATDHSVRVARCFTIGLVITGCCFQHYQLLFLAPLLWLTGSEEQRRARLGQ